MLNLAKIEGALNAQPLCVCHLTRRPEYGSGAMRCAIGAMLAYVGVTDGELWHSERFQGAHGALGIWDVWGDVLKREYGLTSVDEVNEITHTNDQTSDDSARLQRVLDQCAVISLTSSASHDLPDIEAAFTDRVAEAVGG